MEYSLTVLAKLAQLNNLTLNTFVDELNLIGFEVDDVYLERKNFNQYSENTRVLVKIPSNREDLLTETFFLRDLSLILLLTLHKNWKQIKREYLNLLYKNYLFHKNYKLTNIQSEISDILIYRIKLNNLKLNYSPLWVQRKLTNFGLASQNNYFDVINLVTLEWGQSFNCFKALKKEHKTLKLKKLTDTKNTIIENLSYSLQKNNIALFDQDNKIVSFLGYENNHTNLKCFDSIIIEGLYYDIHCNSLNLNNLNDKISLRKLNKISLGNFKFSFQRLLTLLQIIYEATVEDNIEKTINFITKPYTLKRIVTLNKKLLRNLLGIQSFNKKVFKKAGLIIVCETITTFYFEIPSYRHDLLREIDIVEEYSRFIGYKNFPEITPKKEVYFRNMNLFTLRYIKQFFLTLGFNEVITNPIKDQFLKNRTTISLKNPLNNEFSNLRTNIISQLIRTFEVNYKLTNPNKNLFEIGRVFKYQNDKLLEVDKLAGIYQLERIKKEKNQPTTEWFIAKGYIENILHIFGYSKEEVIFSRISEPIANFNPNKSVLIKYNSKCLGIFGELNNLDETRISQKFSTYIFELDLRFFKSSYLLSKTKTYKEVSKYPSIIKDISILISKKINFSKLKKDILTTSLLLQKIEFFDIYFKNNAKNKGKINLGLRLEFNSYQKTLTTEEVELELVKINLLLVKDYEAQLK